MASEFMKELQRRGMNAEGAEAKVLPTPERYDDISEQPSPSGN